MNEGKRGPNGGVIDIDDPQEVMPRERVVLRRDVHKALELSAKAGEARVEGYPQNAAIYLHKATDLLTNAILAAVGK